MITQNVSRNKYHTNRVLHWCFNFNFSEGCTKKQALELRF